MQMIRSTHIQDELNELKSSLKAGTGPVFTVPQGYFEELPKLIIERIKTSQSEASSEIRELSPLLASISRKMPLSLPDGYFETLGQPQEPGTILAGISKSMPYEVPAHYFDDLSDAVLARVWKPKAKVVSFRKFARMAIAAAITGMIAISGWFLFNQPDQVTVNQPEQWVAKKLNDVSNQDLEEFINNADMDQSAAPIASGQKPEVKSMLNDISDSELESFLAQIPENEDVSIN
jgi:hypothetical protein